MASSALRTTAFLVTLNLIFFTLVSSEPLPEATCAINGLKLGVCANVLNDLVHGIISGTPSPSPCCDLFFGLVELEAAACICKAIKANVLGVNLNASASMSLLLNHCGKEVPSGFQCA
ncbi:unnamed protein product [Lactuca saligna]|uniref:Bifunctional inhibitor/plant lipid transfer protein/seed storage helical domain-containing protein n=1 Tax=Lactuca saligna TaxID=75948 RepID=A0AA35ZA74_LACSI|nr:unnamed protein product [Lactuca saligna]